MKKIITSLVILSGALLNAQDLYKGKIVDEQNQPVVGAEVYWKDSEQTVFTDENGEFEIEKASDQHELGVFYMNDENLYHVHSNNFQTLTFKLSDLQFDGSNELKEVRVTDRRSSLRKNNSPINAMTMTSRELLKAACCNLAESFETNPAIDVNFSDAVTGNKQIKMLGLTSPYILIAEENIPSVRGASQAYGLSFTPGTWVENILVTKGMGPVINGYESISGQINTELIKPATDIPFFLNLYASSDARVEANTHYNLKLNDKLSTSIFLHGNQRLAKNDMNEDGFLDNPLGGQINAMNRWQYQDAEKGWVAFLTARYMNDEKWGGQKGFSKSNKDVINPKWGYEINTERVDVNTKVGYVFPETPYQSMGVQLAYSMHDQDSYYGNNLYDIKQQSLYANYIFNSIISNTKNKFAAGASFTYDKYNENLALPATQNLNRVDKSAGVFFEYTYDNLDNFSMILGGRLDHHNRMGTFATPRLHLRYNPWENTTIKASVGRGKRLANIFAENQNLMASSRQFLVLENGGKTYGLDPEIAWNFGGSVTQKFKLFNRDADVTADFYSTRFENQVIADIDYSSHQVLFYNLDGKSFANSFQFDFNYNPFSTFHLRTSYKYYDIATDQLNGRVGQALQAQHRFFANVEYQTNDYDGKFWRFDATYNWFSKQRLPNTTDNAIENQLAAFSNPYSTINLQVTKVFSPRFEIYLGVENLTDYQQDRVILGADNPFGSDFDSSIVYAPVFGRMFYGGLRFKVL